MPPDAVRPPGARRAAVVANPTKHDDVAKLKDAIRTGMAEIGWDEPLWFETTQADPGTGQAAQAVRSGVDLVLACEVMGGTRRLMIVTQPGRLLVRVPDRAGPGSRGRRAGPGHGPLVTRRQ